MGSNEDYLDSLLKSMGNEGETAPEKELSVEAEPNKQLTAEEIEAMFATAEMAVSDEDVPTLDSIKDFSEDEIEQMLAAAEESETDDSENMDMSGADNDDLLALLGGLSDDEEISEISDLLNKDEQNELVDEGIASVWDEEQGFVSEELGALLGGAGVSDTNADKKEEQRRIREEKKIEKQRQKQLKKEEKLRKKEGKKQQKEAQRLVDELEMEREAAEREAAEKDAVENSVAISHATAEPSFDAIAEDESVGLFEAVKGADFTDIFGAQASDAAATSDISSLLAELDAADSDEVVDLFGGAAQTESVSLESIGLFDEAESAGGVEFAMDFTEAKEAESEEKAEKKKGLFSKLFNMLTEEEPEDTISDENRAILDELDAEDRAETKKKKGKKGKADKKKGKDAVDGDEEEDDGKGKGKGKKNNKPKKAKPKKEKVKKIKPVAYEAPSRRISKKSILVVVLFAATVFAVIYFAVTFLSDMLQINSAKAAFEKQDYVTCYEKMYGMDLSEEEMEMFKHAEIVMKMQRRIAVYEKYLAEEMELEALDSLMRAVAGYEELYNVAQAYGAGAEVHAYYMEIIEILESRYGLSQADAIAIATCESNVEYTRYLTALVEGESVSAGSGSGSITLPEEETDDILPAEEELPPQNFAD